MKKALITLHLLLLLSWIAARAQSTFTLETTPVMTLGVFHFSYPNLDAEKTAEEDKITVLDEPWQSEIIAIAKAIEEFRPTIIAVELKPSAQGRLDSLYQLYRSGAWELQTNEVQQLGFRIAANLDIEKLYCIDDMGVHYHHIEALFSDSVRAAALENYYFQSPYREVTRRDTGKIKSIIENLLFYNHPDQIRESLSIYLLHPFKYEETPGDFAGVDFESGRWYNRNLRIFRNIQRIERTPEDRILVIVGQEHLNLLNLFFDVSREFEFVSPLPYLEKALE